MLVKIAATLALVAVCAAQTTTTTTTDKKTLAEWNTAVASSDVCKNDEWSYLCNSDSWAGAAGE